MVAVVLTMPLLGFAALMVCLDAWGQSERAARADCIIVLGARVQPGGVAGLSLTERVQKAVALYHAGYALKLLFTGGLGDYGPEEARVAARLAESLGVPSSDIALELHSHSTWENADNAAQICRARGWKSAVVVSDPFHLWRAKRDFEQLGITAFPSPTRARWLNRRPLLRLHYAAREALCVLRDLTLGPR